MAAWHQLRHPVQMWHDTEWTVVIDPPGEMRALMRFTTKALAEVYRRNLKANNPGAATHAFIVRPASRGKRAS